MAVLCSSIAERSRKNASAILQGLATVGQVRAAELSGLSETKVSRFKTTDLDEVSAILAAAGLKCVPFSMQCFAPEKVQALLTLAKDHLAAIERPEQLTWE